MRLHQEPRQQKGSERLLTLPQLPRLRAAPPASRNPAGAARTASPTCTGPRCRPASCCSVTRQGCPRNGPLCAGPIATAVCACQGCASAGSLVSVQAGVGATRGGEGLALKAWRREREAHGCTRGTSERSCQRLPCRGSPSEPLPHNLADMREKTARALRSLFKQQQRGERLAVLRCSQRCERGLCTLRGATESPAENPVLEMKC